jgi:hypothetical protein
LEELAKGQRANARQRAAAARQIGVWLIARQCLRHPALLAAGERLGKRAVEAARRQLEPHFALAMLREWGQIELDRGDRQAAQRRWAEMLDVVLPQPANRQRKLPGLGSHSTRQLTLPVRRVEWVFAQVPPPAPVASKRQASDAKPSQGPAVTLAQFEDAARVALLAADQKMFALSLRSLGDALRGGPPVSGAENLGRRRFIGARLPKLPSEMTTIISTTPPWRNESPHW